MPISSPATQPIFQLGLFRMQSNVLNGDKRKRRNSQIAMAPIYQYVLANSLSTTRLKIVFKDPLKSLKAFREIS
jgi:hypothetical protein